MSNNDENEFPCPCCGYLVFDEPPGSHAICPFCFWEDDLSQLRFVETVGANHVSLIEGQKNFKKFGSCEERFKDNVKKPSKTDKIDLLWRMIEISKENIERPVSGKDYENSYPKDLTELYYWRPTYWRKNN
jgi:hypothetical protein